jgi:fatty acid-binding protein DegV
VILGGYINTDIVYMVQAVLVAAKNEMVKKNLSFDELLKHYCEVVEAMEKEKGLEA